MPQGLAPSVRGDTGWSLCAAGDGVVEGMRCPSCKVSVLPGAQAIEALKLPAIPRGVLDNAE